MTIQKRKLTLASLRKESALNKIAEDILTDTNLASIEDPEEYAHKIFESLLSNLKIDGIDD